MLLEREPFVDIDCGDELEGLTSGFFRTAVPGRSACVVHAVVTPDGCKVNTKSFQNEGRDDARKFTHPPRACSMYVVR